MNEETGMLLLFLVLAAVFVGGCIVEIAASHRFNKRARQYFGDDWDK